MPDYRIDFKAEPKKQIPDLRAMGYDGPILYTKYPVVYDFATIMDAKDKQEAIMKLESLWPDHNMEILAVEECL